MERRSFLGGLLALLGGTQVLTTSGPARTASLGVSGPPQDRHHDMLVADDISVIHNQRIDSSAVANKRTLRDICARMSLEQRLAPEPYR